MGDHDGLFKEVFSQPEHAAGALATALPRALAHRIDFSTLTRRPGSFVDTALTERHTDLLFDARIAGQQALIYLLFEHLSHADPLMPLRLLRYMVRIWEDHIKKHPNTKRLPVIVPVVLHHSETGWSAATSFEGLLDADDALFALVADHVPRFRFVLDDISHENDEAIRARVIMSALGRIALGLLRGARTPQAFVQNIKPWAGLFADVLRAPNGPAALHAILRYIYKTNKRLDPAVIEAQLLEGLGEDSKEAVLNALEKLQEEGRRKGQREMLLRLLQRKFGLFPEHITARVNAASQDDLDRWFDLILTAPTLDDVFAAEG